MSDDRRSTINDVARLAGVSRMTVSRVVNGSPLVSPATSHRVRNAIQALGYTPDENAQRLGAKSPGRQARDGRQPGGSPR